MNNTKEKKYIRAGETKKIRNLSICPLTPDPIEILKLKEELRQYLRTVEFRNDSIYEAFFTFEYKDVVYRMDNHALATDPARMWKAQDEIMEKLLQFGATNISFRDRED